MNADEACGEPPDPASRQAGPGETLATDPDLPDSTSRILAVLDAAPRIDVQDRVWDRLQSALPAAAATRFRNRRAWAAAAALVLGALGLFLIMGFPGRGPVARVARADEPALHGRSFRSGETLAARGYVRVDLPGVATLHVRPDTTLRFDDLRTVTLETGEVFCDVARGPLTIRTPTATVTDVGTRFGVRVGYATFVYVSEGEVLFDSIRLKGGEVAEKRGPAAAERLPFGAAVDGAAWLSAHVPASPTLDARLDGDALTLTIRNETVAPALIPDPHSLSDFLVLRVTPPSGEPYTLDLTAVGSPRIAGHRGEHGFAVDRDHPLEIRLTLDAALWRERGTHLVRPTISVGRNLGDAGTWQGTIEVPAPLRLEARP